MKVKAVSTPRPLPCRMKLIPSTQTDFFFSAKEKSIHTKYVPMHHLLRSYTVADTMSIVICYQGDNEKIILMPYMSKKFPNMILLYIKNDGFFEDPITELENGNNYRSSWLKIYTYASIGYIFSGDKCIDAFGKKKFTDNQYRHTKMALPEEYQDIDFNDITVQIIGFYI